MVDLAAPDLTRYPRFAEALAHAMTAELEPGDAIYIPGLWWHDVQAAGPFNVLVNYWWGHPDLRSEEHTSELQSLMRISYAVFCLKKKNITLPYTPSTHELN